VSSWPSTWLTSYQASANGRSPCHLTASASPSKWCWVLSTPLEVEVKIPNQSSEEGGCKASNLQDVDAAAADSAFRIHASVQFVPPTLRHQSRRLQCTATNRECPSFISHTHMHINKVVQACTMHGCQSDQIWTVCVRE